MHVCCINLDCYLIYEEECEEMQGDWHPEWDSCDDMPCELEPPESDVCCVGGWCTIVTWGECLELEGEWHPEYDDCDPNPCQTTPIPPHTWGSVKSLYR